MSSTGIHSVCLRKVSPFAPDALALIHQLNCHNLSHYSADACHLDPPEVLARSNCIMIGAYTGPKLCGIGAVKVFGDYGEIKRMFVAPEFRGRGISKLILNRLLEHLRQQLVPLARLETGYKYSAAINLYRKCGFAECDRFGDYEANGTSVFMERLVEPK